MSTSTATPRDDLAGYLVDYPQAMAFGEEDPAAILDRYFTDDVEYWNDGVLLDRERLVAHAKPVRKNALRVEVDVHDGLVDGDRVAARYTMTATLRTGRHVMTDIHMFGRLAADGRLRHVEQLTRVVSES